MKLSQVFRQVKIKSMIGIAAISPTPVNMLNQAKLYILELGLGFKLKVKLPHSFIGSNCELGTQVLP